MKIDSLAIADTPAAAQWGVDPATLARWGELHPGSRVTITKRSVKHGGEERARYPATMVASDFPAPWVVFETHWTMGTHDQGLLLFENGDLLHEIFSPIHPYDAFAVYRPDRTLKGWYGNVTYPAFFADDDKTDCPVLVWMDLFVDIVATPDGQIEVLDEDELAESGIVTSNPELHARILTARDELVARFHARQSPFGSANRLDADNPT